VVTVQGITVKAPITAATTTTTSPLVLVITINLINILITITSLSPISAVALILAGIITSQASTTTASTIIGGR